MGQQVDVDQSLVNGAVAGPESGDMALPHIFASAARLGGGKPRPVDIRVVAATHRDLPQRVAEGEFRADFFYRINVIPIYLPALKDRPADNPLIVHAADTESALFFGDDIAQMARYGNVYERTANVDFPNWQTLPGRDGHTFPAPIGSFRPNLWGIYDMIGNVSEWCHDWYRQRHSRTATDPADNVLPVGLFFDGASTGVTLAMTGSRDTPTIAPVLLLLED